MKQYKSTFVSHIEKEKKDNLHLIIIFFLSLNPGLHRIFNFQNTLAIVYITIILQMSFSTQVQAFTLYNSGY